MDAKKQHLQLLNSIIVQIRNLLIDNKIREIEFKVKNVYNEYWEESEIINNYTLNEGVPDTVTILNTEFGIKYLIDAIDLKIELLLSALEQIEETRYEIVEEYN